MPDWKRIVSKYVQPLQLEGSAEADLVEELSQHLEDRYRELRSAGTDEEQARQIAESELEDVDRLQTRTSRTAQRSASDAPSTGDPKRGNFLEELWKDLKYAGRMTRRSPGFSLFVVLTLALGIGANTTVFTVINTLILNPVPVPNASRLVALNGERILTKSKVSSPLLLSYPDLQDIRSHNLVFGDLAGYSSARILTLRQGTGSRRMFAELATANYFDALGLRPAAGRFFRAEEGRNPGAHPVTVLNYGTWQASFGGAADVVGKIVRLNSIPFTVVGVAPPRFIGLNAIFGPDFWIPVAMAEQVFPDEMKGLYSDRTKTILQGVATLKNSPSLTQAQANISTVAAQLAREYPAADEDRSLVLRPLRDILFSGSAGTATQMLFATTGLLAVVGIVLLIACSNVANLLLARAAGRQGEVAVRLALGASRGRLLRQLLTESILLGLVSGLGGLLLGYAGLHVLFGALPSAANFVQPKFDGGVLLFALLISFATGLLFGTLPALRATKVDVAESLKEESRTMGRNLKKVNFANALLVGQVALSFVLLDTAALFLRSIGQAYGMDPGFQTAHLAVIMTNPGQDGYQEDRAKTFYKETLEKVRRVAGVDSVSWSSNLPLWGRPVNGLEVEGRQRHSQADTITAIVNTIDRNYFTTAGTAIEAGRDFSEQDGKTSVPVAIVNEKMAKTYWPVAGALGKRIQLPGERQLRQIVGIARNASYTNWSEPTQLCVYVPLEQNYRDAMTLYVRTREDPKVMLASLENIIRTTGPHMLITSSRTGRQIVDGGLFGVKMGVTLLSLFGLLALGLASIGLYGILAYTVNQRKREIGLRIALGAARSSVLKMIVKQGMSLVLTGVVIGLLVSLIVGHLLSGVLYGIGASDPVSVGGAAIVLLAIAVVACFLPAHSATRVDPLTALRQG